MKQYKHGVGDLDFDEPVWNISWRRLDYETKNERSWIYV